MIDFKARTSYNGELIIEGFDGEGNMVICFTEPMYHEGRLPELWVGLGDGCAQVTLAPGTLKAVSKTYRRWRRDEGY